ncbi:MAG: hypothetical protein K2W96_04595, partial [Gemmataceae bacterium]|nr:hypothetical protein [Gemmataceae bacterium]
MSVQLDGARARTLVDHVFRNPHDRQLEGTFEYPLPAGASPSYYAMFLGAARADAPPRRFPPAQAGKPPLLPEMMAPAQLARQVDVADWGKLQEARVVSPKKAAEAYEETTRQRIDPALLEYASGNTFRGRVFPIAPKGSNRVIVAYEETLPVIGERLTYRYALPGTKLHEMRFGLSADPAQLKEPTFAPKEARKGRTDSRIGYDHSWTDAKPEGEIVFTAKPKDAAIQHASGKQGDKGPFYLHARVRPDLARLSKLAGAEPFARHAVFLLDTSLSADRDRCDVSMKLVRKILAKDEGITHFNVIAFNAAAAWIHPKGWLPNTKEGRDKALSLLDGILLEGATDLGAALDKLASPPFPFVKGTPVAAFLLSDGHLTWGETDPAPLVARFRASANNPARFFCYRTGLGQENAELFDLLSREGGGVFQCFGEAEVEAAATAHSSECLQVKSVTLEGGKEVLVAGRRAAVYPGGELVVVGQFAEAGKTRIMVKGTFAGKAFEQAFDAAIADGGELAARAWGEVAVASLLSLNDPWTEGLVTAYCQQFGIASRAASFLVLENEAEYKRFGIEEERKERVGNDVGRYVEDAWAGLGKEPSRKQALGKLLYLIDGKTKALTGPAGENVKKMLDLLDEKDCALPLSSLKGAVRYEKDSPAAWLAGRKKDPRDIAPHLDEAQRRQNDGVEDGAAVALSSILEEHSGRGDALRVVGYRLLDMRQPAATAG